MTTIAVPAFLADSVVYTIMRDSQHVVYVLLLTYEDYQGSTSHYGGTNNPASLHLTD